MSDKRLSDGSEAGRETLQVSLGPPCCAKHLRRLRFLDVGQKKTPALTVQGGGLRLWDWPRRY